MERDGVEYIERDESDDEFDEVSNIRTDESRSQALSCMGGKNLGCSDH